MVKNMNVDEQTQSNIPNIVEMTEGFTGADISSLFKEIQINCANSYIQKQKIDQDDGFII